MRNFRPEKLRLDTREIYLRWRSREGAYVLVEPLVVPGDLVVVSGDEPLKRVTNERHSQHA